MGKFLFITLIFVCLSFLIITPLSAQKQDTAIIVNQLNNELQKEVGFVAKDLKAIKKPLKNMLEKGATKDDLKNLLVDLSKAGVRGKDLKDSVKAMNDLVNSGEKPKEVGNIVSRAAHQALAEGLKGEELAARVHEAIRQRKMQREAMKKILREKKTEMRGKTEKETGKPRMMEKDTGPMQRQERKRK